MKILLVDNDESLISSLSKSLTTRHNYIVDAVKDGETGWEYGSTFEYDLIVLDIQLPKLDGISLCQRFRGEGYTMPILFLTVQDTSAAKVQVLDAGADDYVVKPFDLSELCARIRALLRRSSSNPVPLMSWGDLLLNPSTCDVSYNGKPLTLTTKEYRLLEILLWDSKHVFSTEEILDRLWSSEDFPAEATVRSHIRRLRHKLMAVGAPVDFISTVHGRGYYLKAPPEMPSHGFEKLLLPIEGFAENLPLVLGVGLDDHFIRSFRSTNTIRMVIAPTVELARDWLEAKSFPGSSDRLPQGILLQLAESVAQEGLDWMATVRRNYPNLPLLVVGARNELPDRLAVIRRGGTLFLEPSIEPEEVIDSLGQLLNRKNTEPKVMVVDHDRDWLRTLPMLLIPWGLKVTTLEDPQEFWIVFQSVMPDVLVLGVNLPQINGFELCQVVRSDPRCRSLPIVFVSELNDRQTQSRAFIVGGDDYLCKPITVIDLANRILNRIERNRGLSVDSV